MPLHFAVAHKNFEIVNLLIKHKAVIPMSVLEIETSDEIDDLLEGRRSK